MFFGKSSHLLHVKTVGSGSSDIIASKDAIPRQLVNVTAGKPKEFRRLRDADILSLLGVHKRRCRGVSQIKYKAVKTQTMATVTLKGSTTEIPC